MKVTRKQFEILTHSIGIESYGESTESVAKTLKRKKPYRNYFTTTATSDDFRDLEDLLSKGYVTKKKGWSDKVFCYFVTDKTIKAIRNNQVEVSS